jgi:DNA-binding beta-propeller fold protein YncE
MAATCGPARALAQPAGAIPTLHPVLESALRVSSDDMVADPGRQLVYLAQEAGRRMAVVDDTTGNILATASLPTGARHVALDAALHRIYLPDEFSASLVVLDSRTWRRLAVITLGRPGIQPHGVAVDDRTHLVYVTLEHHTADAIVDGRRLRLLATVPVGPTPGGIAVDPALGLVDTVLVGADSVAVFPTATSPFSGTVPTAVRVPVGHRPTHLALDRARHRAFVLATGSNAVAILDQRAGPLSGATRVQTLAASLPAGFAPYSVAVDPVSGGAFIGSSRQPSLLVVTGTVQGYHSQIIHLDTVPGALAVDAARRVLIVAGALPGPPLLEVIRLADLLS